MINPNARNINLIWHNLRNDDDYKQPLELIQQIQIWTSLNNFYYYTRVLDDTVTPPVTLEYTWEVTRNGFPMYVLDDNGNPTTERLTKHIVTINSLLNEFFLTFKPGTIIPIEVPTKVVLN